jgi:uncharacterized protein YcbX
VRVWRHEGDAIDLATLARYRRAGGQVLFGQNAVHLGTGRLAVGAPVEVLETQDPPRFD